MSALGHFQTSGLLQGQVRSSLNNGHVATASGCRLHAKSRLASAPLAGWLRCGNGFLHALDFDRDALLILSTANAFNVALQIKVILQEYFAIIRAGILFRVSRVALCRLALAGGKANEDHENSHRRPSVMELVLAATPLRKRIP